jgi:Tol biopolymer transport system component
VPSEGGSPRQITNGEAEEDSDPSWSPDGSTLVFGGICVHWSIEGSLHAVDVRSGRVSTVAGSKGMWSPRWSPDGNFIAGIGGRGLVLYDVRTQSQIQLPGAAGGYPNWSADGEYLFFKGSGWWRLRMRDRKVELVSSPKGGDVADWGWFVLAPNDSLITTRSTGAGDVYALDLEIR